MIRYIIESKRITGPTREGLGRAMSGCEDQCNVDRDICMNESQSVLIKSKLPQRGFLEELRGRNLACGSRF
jgi:hypothetical protein